MQEHDLFKRFQTINTWKSKGTRAPHKPLLMLLALGEIQRRNTTFIPYSEIKPKLEDLLIDFGPPRKTIYTTFPFIRLANDDLWQFNKPNVLDTKKDYTSKFLLQQDLRGKFPDDVVQQLSQNPDLLREVVVLLLEKNFPDTLHQDILDAVGLNVSFTYSMPQKKFKQRDPHFRESVLRAYEYQCAVCGFSVRLKNKVLALEAAHIMWHQAGGPDVETNGLALCATHHKLFDLGAFTVEAELRMLVSDEVNGQGANDWLIRHHGKSLKPPQRKAYYPAPEFTQWHVNEVFKGSYREI